MACDLVCDLPKVTPMCGQVGLVQYTRIDIVTMPEWVLRPIALERDYVVYFGVVDQEGEIPVTVGRVSSFRTGSKQYNCLDAASREIAGSNTVKYVLALADERGHDRADEGVDVYSRLSN